MPFLVAPTSPDWLEFLESSSVGGREVNFWRPGSSGFDRSNIGLRLIFVKKGKSPRRIFGHGRIVDFQQMSPENAWVRWGEMNGLPTSEEFNNSLNALQSNSEIKASESIGCIILKDVVIFDEERSLSVDDVFCSANGLEEFKSQVVSYKKYPSEFPRILSESTADLIENHPNAKGGNVTPEHKKAIESRAILLTLEAFSDHDPISVESPADAQKILGEQHPGFDILCRDSRLNLEVKGTTTSPWHVRISHNEMRTAMENDSWRLCVVHGIFLDFSTGLAKGVGGELDVYRLVNKQAIRRLFEAIPSTSGCKVETTWSISEKFGAFEKVDL